MGKDLFSSINLIISLKLISKKLEVMCTFGTLRRKTPSILINTIQYNTNMVYLTKKAYILCQHH